MSDDVPLSKDLTEGIENLVISSAENGANPSSSPATPSTEGKKKSLKKKTSLKKNSIKGSSGSSSSSSSEKQDPSASSSSSPQAEEKKKKPSTKKKGSKKKSIPKKKQNEKDGAEEEEEEEEEGGGGGEDEKKEDKPASSSSTTEAPEKPTTTTTTTTTTITSGEGDAKHDDVDNAFSTLSLSNSNSNSPSKPSATDDGKVPQIDYTKPSSIESKDDDPDGLVAMIVEKLKIRTSRRRSAKKKGMDLVEARQERKSYNEELQRSRRDEEVLKKRLSKQEESGGGDDKVPGSGSTSTSSPLTKSKDNAFANASQSEKLEMLPRLVVGLNSDDPAQQLDCVTNIRKLLSIERNPPIQEVIDSGIVPRLIEFLSYTHHPAIQFEASWAVTNIASGTSAHTRTVIDHGGIRFFVQLLRSPNDDVREQAVWALGNIAGDSPACRDLVLREGTMEPLLLQLVPSAKISLLRNATWTLSNLCRGKPQPPFELVSAALPTLATLLYTRDDEVLTDACWALSYISDDNGPGNLKIQAVIQAGIARRIVELLLHKNPNVKTPALRTVGNIVTGDDMQTQVMLNSGILPAIFGLLSHPKKGIRKEACWTVSNITAGNSHQIQAVVDSGLIAPLIHLLKVSEFDVKKEAAWALSNATSGGNNAQITYLVNQGVIPPMCDLLTTTDQRIVMVGLEGIQNILRVGQQLGPPNHYAAQVESCGGLDSLENLQRHDNEEIYSKAVRVIQDFFDGEAVEEAEVESQP